MDIQITGRNVAVNEALKDYVNGRLPPVLADFPRVESAHVILTHEKYRFTAQVTVQGRDKLREAAQETTTDMYAAIDAAVDKLDTQLRKSREKMIDRQHDRKRLAEVESESQTDL
ncbi:MAG: ribosome-associated translation inhibitor RaiA [Kiritimatiellae bacterium]|jgi:putative sigma-54 modulation protein|nr:ribosome-associated translation inhibitor RaiA [Kiritimatiellia bacterium]MDD4340793.1 ribosome-associated translation inhibitor RaiA [Kiritimatiellia bacterium]MDY0148621.1 ribosome-associated translation inhibitor RaiA [Kiritimatiellia bacterium]